MTLLIPREPTDTAFIRPYWPTPTPLQPRQQLARYDWQNAQPSPNPGLLAYYITERTTAITIPLMVKEGVRHNFYRHCFVELNDAPAWLYPMRYHNDPGITIAQERQLVDELRRNTGPEKYQS